MGKPNYAKFEKLFKEKTDPWDFSHSQYEKERFEKIAEFAKSVPHQKILEIGCAEGHLTRELTKISKDVTAIDVSKEAIKRARKRAPQAKYSIISIDEMDLSGKRFDLVIAPEVLYYIRDKKPIFEKIAKSADYLLMSNWRLWDYLLAIHLGEAKLVKSFHLLKWGSLKYCRISLWKLN